MKMSIALLALAITIAPASAQTAPAAPGFSVKAEGNWEMLCHVLSNGDQQNVILNGERSGYANPRLVHAACEASGHAIGDMIITITGAAKCPFKGASVDACTLTVAKGRAVSFEFSAKKAG